MAPAALLPLPVDGIAALAGGLLAATLRSTVLLLAAAAACRALRPAAPSLRHLVWASALLGSLLLPALSWLAPPLEVVLPAGAPLLAPETGAAGPGPTAALLSIWGIGALMVLTGLVGGQLRIRWISRRARPVEGRRWSELLDRWCRRLGIRRRVRLLRSPESPVPMTWGAWRPRVLLPWSADRWPDGCRRNVLIHELAHVRRRDYVLQLAGRLAVALYWFHPLVRMAERRMRRLQEEACDDAVLRAGARPSEYARDLLRVARGPRPAGATSPVSAGGAGGSELQGRMRVLLESDRPRPSASRGRLVVTAAAAAALVAGLAVLTPVPGGTAGQGGPDAPSARSAGPATGTVERIRRAGIAPLALDAVPGPRTGGSGGALPEPPRGVEVRSPGLDAPDLPREPGIRPGTARGAIPELTGLEPGSVTAPGPAARKLSGDAAPTRPRDLAPLPCPPGAGCPADRVLARLEGAGSAGAGELLRPLARHGTEESLGALLEVSYRASRPEHRRAAVEALELVPRARRIGYLYRVARGNPWSEIRGMAVQGLGEIGTGGVVPLLASLAYRDADRDLQRFTVRQLAAVASPGVRGLLRRIASTHPEPAVRAEALYWLLRSGGDAVRGAVGTA